MSVDDQAWGLMSVCGGKKLDQMIIYFNNQLIIWLKALIKGYDRQMINPTN